ncbi:MAG: glycogen synthase GlgA [Candidatus Aegiribacteria sp.]|nr:glycogen synthase GlgA [Candidatus Aegiribacteria sp.]MBD3295329.1 glycogen synthase GlgA [Candidatus Fermentibacteria bacterium]
MVSDTGSGRITPGGQPRISTGFHGSIRNLDMGGPCGFSCCASARKTEGKKEKMRIMFAASEAYPFISTGGLAGVTGSLPAALQRLGHDVSLVMPLYSEARVPENSTWRDAGFSTYTGEKFGVLESRLPGTSVPVYFVSKNEYFNRPGIYGPDDASAYGDNSERFSFFCRAVTALADVPEMAPDVLHCHDWQTGLVPAYIRQSIRPACVFTIHNLRYQGCFPEDEYTVTLLPRSLYTMYGLEFYGEFSFLKAGIVFCDRITTVSPTYAREIQTPEYGEGMDGILRANSYRLSGILNGIDYSVWDPAADDAIPFNYNAAGIPPRRRGRRLFLEERCLDPSRFTVGVVSRLTRQKGLDLLFPVAEDLFERGINLVVLGTGEKVYMDALRKLEQDHPDCVSISLTYDEKLARRMFAGCDVIVMPSRFEPCGLAQMMAMRYGAVPVVRKTGGLADTVSDFDEGGTGFVFQRNDPAELLKNLCRAANLYNRGNRWPWLVKKCMEQDNSWDSRAGLYAGVYEDALSRRGDR